MAEGRSVDVAAVKHRLGRVGVWLASASDAPAAVERPVVVAIEQLGYCAFWFAETPRGKEALTHAATVLSWTERMLVATGIANIYARDAVAAANGAATLGDAWPGRFVLGLGVSHAPAVTARGHDYGRPVATMRSYLDAMDSAEHTVPVAVPRLLGALRPRMLELSRTHAQGAHTYFTTPEHTARAREVLGEDAILAVEQAVVVGTDAEAARATARQYAARYLSLPNYRNHLRELGFSDADLDGGGSDALIDAVVPSGDPDAVAERVRAHHDAGADHVCVQPLAATLDDQAEHLRLLAPVLTT
ncbi:TIGR03620 family F420-dependent LLM class oxidoreductase [Actinoallomurus iriomotensis]|uniref:LLM class F420-dependent oxidoreductase n=1 Tax=Actinoallomurus iriomotensis TaxID=478107 RepID=A0A9W6RMV8_9ACTN|nr:TIGR03620 family F420-dependent LLM class oxidoreductase [Actinoallomurus iriomotensis]GLY78404.1 LLM class F420-dependent oxidoreductase [Actinoallomurus iriomotensis]